MKLWNLAFCATVAAFGLAGAALADDAAAPAAPANPNAPVLAFNAGVTSDYLFRGIDQSLGPAGFAGADLTIGKVYFGTWVSQVDFDGNAGNGNHTLAEVDVYGGFKPVIGNLTLDIGGIGYLYPGQPSGSNENYFEAKFAGTLAVGAGTVGGVVYYSPNNFGNIGESVYYEGNASYTFKSKASLSGAVGYQALDKSKTGLSGYATWNVGVGYPITDHLGIDLRYIGTSSEAKKASFFGGEDKHAPFNAGDRIVATLKATF